MPDHPPPDRSTPTPTTGPAPGDGTDPDPPAPVPVAAYRIQQWTEGGFAGASARVDHIATLGASHLYTAPVTAATPGSTHGYDGTDPGAVATQLGGDAAFDELCDHLDRAGLGLIIDIVPNHLGVGDPSANRWWWETLRDGPRSASARLFDIDWAAAGNRVVLPVLGRPLDEVITAGAVSVVTGRDGDPAVSVDGFVVPLRRDVPVRPDAVGGDPAALTALLARQHHRLDPWQAGTRNYRVFFDVSHLAGVAVEDDTVFDDLHRLPVAWATGGRVAGIRVDHVDGLVDPDGYLDRLRRAVGDDCWLLIEKIVIGDETTPERWPVEGTTGYEAATWLTRALIDPATEDAHTALVEARLGPLGSWHDLDQAGKDEAALGRLAVDVARLAERAGVPAGAVAAVAASLPVYRTYLPAGGDADRATVGAAVLAAGGRRPDLRDDIARFGAALGLGDRPGTVPAPAGNRPPPTRPPTGPDSDPAAGGPDGAASEVLIRWQQLTGPVMAKGVEDTALYRHRRLGALNDVGSDPSRFGCSVEELHRAMARRLDTARRGLTTTTTHDTKRSADVRARLAVLPGVGDAWAGLLDRWWPALTASLPASTAYLLAETTVGAWPVTPDRILGFLVKAEREAGTETSWLEPDDGFEEALTATVTGLWSDPGFGADIDRFVTDHLLGPGRVNSLTQVLLRCTVPGVPDVYQGDEIWNLRLVDPDNRAPVDWDAVTAATTAATAPGTTGAGSLAHWDDAVPKTLTLTTALAARQRWPAAFDSGAYRSLRADGPDPERVLAFTRGDRVLVVAPRFPERGPVDAWLTIPTGSWRDCFDPSHRHPGGLFPIGESLARFPVALWERLDDDTA